MELAIGMFSTMLSGAGAGASWLAGTTAVNAAGATVFSGASTAAGMGASLAGLGSSALSVLQGAATVGSALATLGAGQAQVADAKLQSSASALEARSHSLRIREEELEKIGQVRVGFAASGVDLSSGAALENRVSSDSSFERGMARTTGRISSGQIKLRGKNAMLGAAAQAGGKAADFVLDLARRG
jgi:hypothetical protein